MAARRKGHVVMYCDFFGFTEKPFRIIPNPRFLFLSRNHKEVFAHLLYGLRSHCGFIEITGEVGTGKTTVLRTLLAELEGDAHRLAFIFNPSLSADELLRAINREFGIDHAGTAAELLDALNHFLLRENAAGRTVVLVIDEAQNLEPAVLEQIRLLSNLETESDKLIQIVLVGQPELGWKLEQPALRQLSQRITVRYHLQPMDFDDARDYIAHRLRVAGHPGGEVFLPNAVKRIYRFSKGVPRLINVLCDRALLVGYTENSRLVSAAMVETAIAELQRQPAASRPRSRLRSVFAAVAVSLAVALSLIAWWHHPDRISSADIPGPPAAVDRSVGDEQSRLAVPAPPAATDSWLDSDPAVLRRALASLDSAESFSAAFNGLARQWREAPLRPGEKITDMDAAREAFRQRELLLTPYRGDLESMLRLDSPALVELTLPGVPDRRCLAVISVSGERMKVSPPIADRDELTVADMKELWPGFAYLPWRNYLELPNLGRPDAAGEEVLRLQQLLREAGVYSGTPSGRYDAATISSVTRFQASRGIVQDGRVGPQTLMLLYQEAGRFERPRLLTPNPEAAQ